MENSFFFVNWNFYEKNVAGVECGMFYFSELEIRVRKIVKDALRGIWPTHGAHTLFRERLLPHVLRYSFDSFRLGLHRVPLPSHKEQIEAWINYLAFTDFWDLELFSSMRRVWMEIFVSITR